MSGSLIEEDLVLKYRIIDKDSSAGQEIHNTLFPTAQLLAGHIIDFKKSPVAFVMSDLEQPNAFFVRSPKQSRKPKRDEFKNISYIKNPYDSAVIGITKGLKEMADNIDQLAYVLGHELTHMILRGYGVVKNSKGEEALANLHAVDLVYDAGFDPKEALKLHEKISEYARKNKEKIRRQRERQSGEEKGIDWSEILDVHMTDSNTTSALQASLTRLWPLQDFVSAHRF